MCWCIFAALVQLGIKETYGKYEDLASKTYIFMWVVALLLKAVSVIYRFAVM